MRVEVNAFDEDYTAFYVDPNFTVGTEENQRQVSFVIRMNDVTDYDGIERNTIVDCLVVPAKLNEYGYNQVARDYEGGDFDNPFMVAEACTSYGSYATVSSFAASISFDGTSLQAAIDTDDWDTIVAWIEAHGEKLARGVMCMIGFALDQRQNRIGETGWDWLMPLMYDDYTSDTMFIHRVWS